MAGYRDDLEAAKLRIEHLEEQLAERDAQLEAQLEAQLDAHRRRRVASPLYWIRLRVLVLGAVAGIGGMVMMCGQRSAGVEPAPPPQACEEHRQYASLFELPPGTELLRFYAQGNDCRECVLDDALKRAGIVASGVEGPAPRGLQASGNTMSFALERPVRLFAALFRPGAVQTFPKDRRAGIVVMKGRDAEGRVVDVVRAQYPAIVEDHEAGEPFASRARLLVVEACGGADLASIEIWSSELNAHITDLAYLP